MNEILREATSADCELLAAFINAAYRGDSSRQGWTTEADLLDGQRTDVQSLRETLSQPDSVILMLLHADKLVGSVFLQNQSRSCYLGMLTVKPSLQSSGIGKRLLRLAEEFARDRWGASRISMTVIHKRSELIEWYKRRGYLETGRREPFPYREQRVGLPKTDDLEFVVLEKSLNAGQL
jgi:ribosomal protein S18 acetylase RimI-like enzyme